MSRKIKPENYDSMPRRGLAAQEALKTADLLIGAFGWSDTPEGFNYWRSVYNRLIAIGNGRQLA